MTYRIEFTPGRLTVRADLETEADIAALQRALAVLTPLIGAGANRSEEITRKPKHTKALRSMRAEKEIRPGPQKSADLEQDQAPERIVGATSPVTAPEPQKSAVAKDDAKPAVTAPGRVTSASVPVDRDDKLRKLWATTLTLQQIADKLGMGHLSNVSTRAKYLGLPSRLRGGERRSAASKPADTFDPAYYAKHAIIQDDAPPPARGEITAALMGDPAHGASVCAERAGGQRDGGAT